MYKVVNNRNTCVPFPYQHMTNMLANDFAGGFFFFQIITIIINSLWDLNAKGNNDALAIFLLISYVIFLVFHKYSLENNRIALKKKLLKTISICNPPPGKYDFLSSKCYIWQ